MHITAPQAVRVSSLSVPLGAPTGGDADFRQLRHQTKNALARMLLHVSKHLAPSDPAHRIAAELERRILLTAEMSDALFGLTRAPGPLEARLRALATGLVDLLGDPDQQIRVEVAVRGAVPRQLEDVVLRVAHELVGNAIKHGLHMRVVGRIQVTVLAGPDGTVLDVADDGWGCGAAPPMGESLKLVELLAAPHGGKVGLLRRGEFTVGTLWIPAA